MSKAAEALIAKHFGDWEHPYRRFEREVGELLRPGDTLLDVGCGRTAPVLQKFHGRAARLVGIDLVDFSSTPAGVELYRRDIGDTGLADASVDVVMARSVMEHVVDAPAAFREVRRILKPGGRFLFLTANLWDYASVVARVVPNRLHPWIVRQVEGRAEEDVFPIAYKCNTRRQIAKLAAGADMAIDHFEYLGQYPSYLLFSKTLFLIGTAYEKTIARHRALNWLRGWILVTIRKP